MSILINANTTFIVQGITGREAVSLTRENLDYGAKIVGGVTPGRAGRDVYGVPVFDCVRDITAKTTVDGSRSATDGSPAVSGQVKTPNTSGSQKNSRSS